MSDELETITIDELSEATSLLETDEFILENASHINKKILPGTVKEYMSDGLQEELDATQMEAVNSGINSEKVAQYDALVMQNIFNACHPIGDKYIQYPGDAEPEDLYNVDGIIDSTWEDISEQFAGLFFRVAGGNAEEFNKSLAVAAQSGTTLTFATGHGITTGSLLVDTSSKEQRAVTNVSGNTVTIESAFSQNLTTVLILQNSGAPNITGNTSDRAPFDSETYEFENGALRYERTQGGGRYNSGSQGIIYFNASKGETKTDGTLKTSSEHKVYGSSDDLQVKNATIRLWRRTA